MDNELYRKKTFERIEKRSYGTDIVERRWILLTAEVNRLILWEEIARFEETDVIVLKTFELYLKNDAIECAVKTALQAIEDAPAEPIVPEVADDIAAERAALEAQRDHDEGELDPERHRRAYHTGDCAATRTDGVDACDCGFSRAAP